MIASGGPRRRGGDRGPRAGLFIWSVIAVGLSLRAFAPRARAQRAAELQERADRLEREREERTRAAVAAERARIARDLHDVIAHSVSVMTVQGVAARLLLDSDDRVGREPLLVVEETGR
jgi:signal transduction histidine kinase